MSASSERAAGAGPMENWYDRAGVRRDPRRLLSDALDQGRTFFPHRLVPYLDHPVVAELPARERDALVARHLFQYLTFTAQFEIRVVCRAAGRIADGGSGLVLPAQARLDSYKVCCDEGYHALYSQDVVEQVSSAAGIAPVESDFDAFLSALDGIGDRLMPDQPLLVQMLQVVVFETLVTSILNDVPRDPSVLALVREIVRDHAIDEGRHHAYFAWFFQQLWASLDSGLRERVAQILPELIVRSLQPHRGPVRRSLAAAGLDAVAVRAVLDSSYRPERVLADIRSAAARTVGLFEQTGVLDVPGGREHFAVAGLL